MLITLKGLNNMFSGIIESLGRIQTITALDNGYRFTIHSPKVLRGTKIGDSIATDGICLTVVKKTWTSFSVDVMKETIDRTALSIWRVGSLVNLERALSTGQRNGGHHVSGHIDTVGNILEKNEEGIATRLIISLSPSYTKYLIEKGSIALDGISLTLTKVWDDRFEVSLIPHTKLATTIYKKKVGDPINIEVDMMAKFIEKLMAK